LKSFRKIILELREMAGASLMEHSGAENQQFEIRNSKSEILAMSEPQIAHRCPSCGASIRTRALFCPHCGETLPESKRDSAKTLSDYNPDKKDRKARKTPVISDGSKNKELEIENLSAATSVAAADNGRPGPRESANTVRMASGDVREEDRRQGVERLRHISSVVLDEAAYDPSLRFVLVAAVLFVVFIVLVVISEVLR
jgi:predicted RNA-binding Zn-ribbon protein involved in translation (DUF1610 family)